MSWTTEQYEQFQRERNAQAFADAPRAPKPSKYKNIKTVIGGVTFDSKREAVYWAELKIREKAGDITALERQVPYELRCPIDMWPPEREAVVSAYIADVRFCDRDGKVHVVDVKGGKETPMFALKRKWLFLQSGIEIEVIR